MLAALPFKIIVTTNYDRLLEVAMAGEGIRKDPAVFIYNPNAGTPTPDMTEDPTQERPLLFKMHGDLDHRDSIVITDRTISPLFSGWQTRKTSIPSPGQSVFEC